MDSLKLKNLALFAGGVLFGTAGVKILSSKDVKKVYVEGTAAVLRARDCVMKTAETVQDVYKRQALITVEKEIPIRFLE